MRRLFGKFILGLATAFSALMLILRPILDLVGYSTAPEDAGGLLGKVRPLLNFVANEPALQFYSAMIIFLILGGWLILEPAPYEARRRQRFQALQHRLKWWGVSWDWSDFLSVGGTVNRLNINSVNLYGRNNSNKWLTNPKAYIENPITGERIDFTIVIDGDDYPLDSLPQGIRPKSQFHLLARFPRTKEKPPTIEGVWIEWPEIIAVFEADGYSVRHKFPADIVQNEIFRRTGIIAQSQQKLQRDQHLQVTGPNQS